MIHRLLVVQMVRMRSKRLRPKNPLPKIHQLLDLVATRAEQNPWGTQDVKVFKLDVLGGKKPESKASRKKLTQNWLLRKLNTVTTITTTVKANHLSQSTLKA
jgi:hypothetical protein